MLDGLSTRCGVVKMGSLSRPIATEFGVCEALFLVCLSLFLSNGNFVVYSEEVS